MKWNTSNLIRDGMGFSLTTKPRILPLSRWAVEVEQGTDVSKTIPTRLCLASEFFWVMFPRTEMLAAASSSFQALFWTCFSLPSRPYVSQNTLSKLCRVGRGPVVVNLTSWLSEYFMKAFLKAVRLHQAIYLGIYWSTHCCWQHSFSRCVAWWCFGVQDTVYY